MGEAGVRPCGLHVCSSDVQEGNDRNLYDQSIISTPALLKGEQKWEEICVWLRYQLG